MSGTVDNLDEIARDIRIELQRHGGGEFVIELAAGGVFELEVTDEVAETDTVVATAHATKPWTVRGRWPDGQTMCETVSPQRFLAILPRFLRKATTPRPVITI